MCCKRCNYDITILIQIILLFVSCYSAINCNHKENDEIIIGGLFDLTGPTHEICVPYADGIRNYISYINENNGINGRNIRLIEFDYSYIIPLSISLYEELAEEKVISILGWGTGDTEALVEHVRKDKIPFMSASYSENLTITDIAPYNFLIGVTYSDQIKIILKYIDENWNIENRKPRIAFIYNDTPFGYSPIECGKEYIDELGLNLVSEQVVSLDALEAYEQINEMKEANADYIIVQETTWAMSVILKQAAELEMDTQFIGLNWCADEKLIALAGDAAEGFMGTIPFAFCDRDLPGIKNILQYYQSKGLEMQDYILRNVQGWTTAMVMFEGIRLAGDDISGENIKENLENIRNFNTGGITAPVNFSPDNHKGCSSLKLGKVIDGKWVIISDYISLN